MQKTNLMNQLSEADQKKVKEWTNKQLNPSYDPEIPPELYVIANFAVYYPVEIILRGYIEGFDEKTQKRTKIPFSLEDAIALTRAAEKVRYRHLVEQADTQLNANLAARCRPEQISDNFRANMKPYLDKAK